MAGLVAGSYHSGPHLYRPCCPHPHPHPAPHPAARRRGPAQGAVAEEPQQRGVAGAAHPLHAQHRGDEHGGLHPGPGGQAPLQSDAGPILGWVLVGVGVGVEGLVVCGC